uniref:LRRNT domain-containing protein n=1 Tax=Pygocentrus nattereri TaxID=42514 RepID=A0A3B4DF49_PYGNA
MRRVILLFWIFTRTAETLALQPSNKMEEDGTFKVEGRKMPTEDRREEKENHEKEQEKRTEKTDAGREDTTGETEHEQERVDDPEKNSNWSKTETEKVYLSATPPTVHQIFSQHNTPPATPSPSQHVQLTVHPLMSAMTQSPPAVIQLSNGITDPVTVASHLLVTNVSTLLTNQTSSDVNSTVAQIEKGNLEEMEVAPTATAARAGPTAMILPKPQLETNTKDNLVAKIKKNKLPKKHKVKEKKTKALKKGNNVKKLAQERDEMTSAPYFPYFKDHYCPPDCTCYGRVVQCSDKELDRIPYGIPYNSRYVLLMNNHINSIQLDLLSEYLSMEFLVLSSNRLTDSSVEGVFEGIQALKRLYLERNFLQSIPTDLPTSLEELRMDGNKVSVMSEVAWSRCPGLLILSLNNNSLGSLAFPAGVLSPLVSLRTLSLSQNQLTSVPLHLPLSLQELYLRGNRILRFQSGVFQGKAELLVLDLSANRLTNKGLGKAALINATHLESLNLEGNLLKHVPRHLPRSLKTLNLEGNSISSVSKAAFLSLPHLEHLGLARNKLSKVAPGAFWTLPLLHQLDLSHNALRQVPRQLPIWLVSLSLTHNKIETIPRDAFCWARLDKTPSSRLVRVQLENNLVDLGSLDSEAFSCLRGFQVVHFY